MSYNWTVTLSRLRAHLSSVFLGKSRPFREPASCLTVNNNAILVLPCCLSSPHLSAYYLRHSDKLVSVTMLGRKSASDSSSDVEVIEDSEPERQERLAKSRLTSKQSQNNNSTEVACRNRISQATTLTQMSVSSTSGRTASAVSTGAPPPNEDEVQPPTRLSRPSSEPVRKPAPPPWLASTTNSTPLGPSTNLPSSSKPISPKSSSQHSPVKQIDLNSFAFQKRSVDHSTRYSTSSYSVSHSKDKEKDVLVVESCSDVSQVSASSTKISSSPKVFILDVTKEFPNTEVSFTAEQVNSLRGCVVCGNAWTARKLPKHKWSHITSCARKGGCEPDVLYVKLISAVVDTPEPKSKKSVKGKQAQKEDGGPQSLFAHTVQNHAPPKKRGRRAEPRVSGLQPVEDTRKAILERGAALLGVAPILDVESQPDMIPEIPTELSEDTQDMQEEEPNIPATQGFAPSKIGGCSRLFGSTLATLNMDTRSGLLYADLPCTVLPNTTTRSLSTFEKQSASNPPILPLYLTMPRSVQSALSSDSSIISISSSNDSGPNPVGLFNLDNRTPSPALSDSIIILDSTHSDISRRILGSPSPPINSHASFAPSSRRQSFGEGWESQEGVYKWEDYDPSRPPSPTDSLANCILEVSIRENSVATGEVRRGRSKSPRLSVKSRSRSRKSSRSSRKKSKSPTSHSKANRQKFEAPGPSGRCSSRGSCGREKSNPLSKKAKARARSRSRSRSRSSREPSPKARRRTRRKGDVYAPEDGEDCVRSKDLDARLMGLILRDKELQLRILRYEPIKFEDILDMAIKNGAPKHGLPIKLKAFLDSQCINFYSAEALGRKKSGRA
ncbi:unnamed protein product [Rhizoctonia solani]|uniref:Structure-specific endonuclease subunit SLX4 n=1 Tax=Rhizoctonia solani TaxID=456999 RepID=A0A8H2WYX3_9AGAM|nr:unnamed protein product [Rhizoctonia solani]